ncbi:hypothetical protein [Schaalia radingae]|uniref:Phage gp6-like head-tail connector protein n=1 Tax=Schaalia radingae TaxID=131110 RepID=A0ABY0VCF8_9ACTO|nr:hypothetical protein [Schaalia radingae]SDU08335.1 hypothetical protein SAMN04489714_2057 [Schaalia radingae]
MTTWQDLQQYVAAPASDQAFLELCTAQAESMVSRLVRRREVPQAARDAAQLEVAANLYQRRTARRDITNFSDGTAMPLQIRPALDPLTPARPILAPYLGVGIA